MDLEQLVAAQDGVVSRAQALACGFTEDALTWRLRSGRWQRVHPGVYATLAAQPSSGEEPAADPGRGHGAGPRRRRVAPA